MLESNSTTQARVKIAFPLKKDADDYPPANWEHLWAVPVGNDVYEIDNIPFFVKSVAIGDQVRAEQVDNDLVFRELVETSGHTTLRVLVSNPDNTQNFRDELHKLGCESELSHIDGLIAVDVPPGIHYPDIRDFLDREEAAHRLGYEEAALGQAARL